MPGPKKSDPEGSQRQFIVSFYNPTSAMHIRWLLSFQAVAVLLLGGVAIVPPVEAQSDDWQAEHATRVEGSVDTSWVDLDRFADRMESMSSTKAFQRALVRYGLAPEDGLILRTAVNGKKMGEVNPDSTHIDVFYANLFGEDPEEAVVQVRSHGYKYFLSFYRKQEGRWHPLPYRIDQVPNDRPAPSDIESCSGSVCFDFVDAYVPGESLLVVQRATVYDYKGYDASEKLFGYQIRPDRPVRVLYTELDNVHVPYMKHRMADEEQISYRWAKPVPGGYPRYVVLKEVNFEKQYEVRRGNLRRSDSLRRSGTQWGVRTLDIPNPKADGSDAVRRPSAAALSEAGVTVTDTSRHVHLDGSLRALQERLQETTHPDSLSARLRRHGLVPPSGLLGNEAAPNPDSVHVELFPANLFGDPLREVVVQVRSHKQFYSLAVFQAIAGGWKRLPGIVHIDAPHQVEGCPGRFCFRFAEARAKGEQLVSGIVGGSANGTTWIPIQVTSGGMEPLAHTSMPAGTQLDWMDRRDAPPSKYDDPFPKYGALRVPLDQADSVRVRTGLPNDSTGQGHRVRVADLDYVEMRGQPEKTAMDSVWARAERVGASDQLVYPPLKPISVSWGEPGMEPPSELHGVEWRLSSVEGQLDDLPKSLVRYLQDLRRAIEHEKWTMLAEVCRSADQSAPDTEKSDLQRVAWGLGLDKQDKQTLQHAGVDSVSYDRWSFLSSSDSSSQTGVVRVVGMLRFSDGTETHLQLHLGIRNDRVVLGSASQFENGQTKEATGEVHSPKAEEGGAFGQSVSSIGDVNGDGVPDVAIGTPSETVAGKEDAGRVYVMSGKDRTVLHTVRSPSPEGEKMPERQGGYFGRAVADIGDVSGDGVTDVVVGAPTESAAGKVEAGRVYVVGGAEGSIHHVLQSPHPERDLGIYGFGHAVLGVGDRNGDSIPDIVVGAPGEESEAVYLFSGKSGNVLYTLQSSSKNGREFGKSLATVGDVDGDGKHGT